MAMDVKIIIVFYYIIYLFIIYCILLTFNSNSRLSYSPRESCEKKKTEFDDLHYFLKTSQYGTSSTGHDAA